MWCRPWSFMWSGLRSSCTCNYIGRPRRSQGAPLRAALPAPVGRLPVLVGAHGDDAARVDRPVREVVVAADVVEADGLRDAGRPVEVARVRPEVRVVDDPLQAALEVDVVD